jgi:hypothetical protein
MGTIAVADTREQPVIDASLKEIDGALVPDSGSKEGERFFRSFVIPDKPAPGFLSR